MTRYYTLLLPLMICACQTPSAEEIIDLEKRNQNDKIAKVNSFEPPIETIAGQTKTVKTNAGIFEIYDPTKDVSVLEAFDYLYDVSPKIDDIRFDYAELLYYEKLDESDIRKNYRVLYKAAHKQRLSLAPHCSRAIVDSNCNVWWNVNHNAYGQGSKQITPASAGYRQGCKINDQRVTDRPSFPIGKNFYSHVSPTTAAPSKEEQLRNFYMIGCSD